MSGQDQPIGNHCPEQAIIFAPYEMWAVEHRHRAIPDHVWYCSADNKEDAKSSAAKHNRDDGEKSIHTAVRLRVVEREEVEN
jgi:hypothetical protein